MKSNLYTKMYVDDETITLNFIARKKLYILILSNLLKNMGFKFIVTWVGVEFNVCDTEKARKHMVHNIF